MRPAAVTVFAVLATGCGIGTPTVDTQGVADQIASSLRGQGAAVKSVTCPGDQKAAKGAKFDCDLVAPGGSRSVAHVTLLSADGRFDFSTGKPGATP